MVCYMQFLEETHFGCRFPWNRPEYSKFPNKICDHKNKTLVMEFGKLLAVMDSHNSACSLLKNLNCIFIFHAFALCFTVQHYSAMNDNEFISKTGCKPRCKANLYTANEFSRNGSVQPKFSYQKRLEGLSNKHISVINGTLSEKPTMQISLFFSHPTITVEEEVYLYDGQSFFGEVGGYMGLLLGASILSMYEDIEGFVKKNFIKRGDRRRRRSKIRN